MKNPTQIPEAPEKNLQGEEFLIEANYVEYVDSLPEPDVRDQTPEDVARSLFLKQVKYAHEKEVRLIAYEKPDHSMPIPPMAVSSLTLGHSMPEEHIAHISAIASERLPHVEIRRA